MAREINLVPDVKGEMIKALKLRNLIFFLSIVVASASVAVTVIVGLIMGGQQLIVDNNQNTIKTLSDKIKSYGDLNEFLTIKDQVGNISSTTSNKKVLSRTFNILRTLLPTGADTITISELAVNLSSDSPTFTFDAQANAGKDPFIDYNVLDAFKKSMQFMKYDYGNYVDKAGNNIPAYCIIEQASDGSILKDNDNLYAFWTINGEGCNPSADIKPESYSMEEYEGQQVVRIWRTPQFSDWYKTTEVTGQPYMSLDGAISNVPHFKSACITYSGDNRNDSENPKWTSNNECMLVPGGQEGIKITDSSNGRSENEELVLRFSAVISLNPAIYNFNNAHALAIPPSGRVNVTDSYVQVQAMFGERAADCAAGDTTCINTPTSTNTNDSSSTNQTNDNASTDNNSSNSNGGNNG